MTTTKRWHVDIFIDEHDDDTTRAEARLRTHDQTTLTGVGTARRNPHDTNVPEIGDELAAARALGKLAGRLLQTSADDIEDTTHESVDLLH
jgi:hypothetical protein